MGFIPCMQGQFNIQKATNPPNQQAKEEKSHKNINKGRKSILKIQQQFMIKKKKTLSILVSQHNKEQLQNIKSYHI